MSWVVGVPFRSFLLLACINITWSWVSGQNLISNPGFEKCERCGMFGNSGVELALGSGANDPVDWYGVTYGTSDFRPDQPNSGRYHGGFFSFGKFEYLGNVLAAPLLAGAEYELSCHLGTRFDSEFTLDEIGFCFQNGLNTYPVNGPLNRLSPQLTTADGDFLPFRSYKKYSFKYIACGGEDHLIIGRFKDLSRGDTLYLGSRRTGSVISYTMIDDLELKMIRPALDLIPDQLVICKGANRKIGLDRAINYQKISWSNGSTGDSLVISDLDSIVWVEVFLGQACAPIRDSSRIVVLDNRPDPLRDTGYVCPGASLVLSPDSAGLLNPKWSHGPVQFKTELGSPGKYRLEADSPCGKIVDSILVLSADVLPADILDIEDTCYVEGISFSAPFFSGASYSWSDGSLGKEFRPGGPGTYHVRVTGVCNEVEDSLVIRGSLSLDSLFLIPNVFTPNGDRENDSFRPLVRPGLESLLVDYQLQIFNRWGKLLFEARDPAKSWIPDADTGTESYLYQLRASYRDCPRQRTAVRSGVISLIR